MSNVEQLEQIYSFFFFHLDFIEFFQTNITNKHSTLQQIVARQQVFYSLEEVHFCMMDMDSGLSMYGVILFTIKQGSDIQHFQQ